MKNAPSFSLLKFDVWLIDQLLSAPYPGLTLKELRNNWSDVPNHAKGLSRDMLTAHRKSIKDFLGLEIMAPDRMHYRIMNPDVLKLDSLANDLLKSIQNFVFLQEYKDLGNLIQPEKIETGARYLRLIGLALRDKRKLRISYQKFSDEDSYDAILHPYCLKADRGRWYIFAEKEGSAYDEVLQCFALDRTKSLTLMHETFIPNTKVDIDAYFRDCFGVWRDYKTYPVADISISCTDEVAHYLRTLPLHHSQKESAYKEGKEGRIIFTYHISPSPDFIGELLKWCDGIRIKDN